MPIHCSVLKTQIVTNIISGFAVLKRFRAFREMSPLSVTIQTKNFEQYLSHVLFSMPYKVVLTDF